MAAPLATTADAELENIAFFLGRAYFAYIGLLERTLSEEGLNDHLQPGMGNILFALFERDDQTISRVASRLRLSKPTMTGMVARAREAGLITTVRDSNDGRAIRLRLTPLARSLESRCRKVSRRVEEIICRPFGPRKQANLRAMLAAMIESMNAENEPG